MDRTTDEEQIEKDTAEERVYILYIYHSVSKTFTGGDLADMMCWLCRRVNVNILSDGNELSDAIQLAFMTPLTEVESLKLQALRDLRLGIFDGKVVPPPEMDRIFRYIIDNNCSHDTGRRQL